MNDNQTTNLETIREKLAKLKTLIDCPGATEGERESARLRYDEILKKHGLTEESVSSDVAGPSVLVWGKRRWGRKLMLQCASWIMNKVKVPVMSVTKEHAVFLLTPLDAADLRACFAYYAQMMEEQIDAITDREKRAKAMAKEQIKQIEKELEAKLKENAATKAELLEVLWMKYKIYADVEPSDRPAKAPTSRKVTEREVQEYVRRERIRKSLTGDAWERAKKVGEGQEQLRLVLS
ncbi:hypothetical protein [Verrucomicrobium spinosum]|uniref:hypothetical protein n=1 Tax=Verrucomicrobium spinosum TaxID=2736 RepID=UPI00017452EE|nr:hypothetical protein [Verrucomicrobium spinosum]